MFLGLLFGIILLFNNSFAQNDQSNPDKYFQVFLNKNGNNLAEVFLQHQPNLNDCKIMFTAEYYKTAFQNINQLFAGLSEEMDTQDSRFKNRTACRATKFSTNDVISQNCTVCPGRMKKIADKFRPDINCFQIEFLETTKSEYGATYLLFSFINGRWVYFPMN